jgi:hypothetical protein
MSAVYDATFAPGGSGIQDVPVSGGGAAGPGRLVAPF